MERATTLAWVFDTDLPWLKDVKKALDAATPKPWVARDSETKQDSISAPITEHAVARIYEYGKGVFVAQLLLRAVTSDAERHLAAAKSRLFTDVFPLIKARNVAETRPPE